MVAVGPVLGGWLATDFSWRWAFFINAPLGAIILFGLGYFIAESKVAQKAGGIDFIGAGISVIMFSTFVFSLIEGRVYGWWEVNPKNQFSIGDFQWPSTGISVIPVAFLVAIISTVIFVFWEKRRERQAKNVLLDLKLFHISSFRNGSIAAAIISMGEFGILFAIPLWLQNVVGLNPVSSGLVLLWLAGGAFVASGIGGALSGRLPANRAVQIGVSLELVGVAGIATFLSAETGWGVIAPFLFVYGIGIGLATAQLTGVIMVDVPPAQIGQASGSQSTVRQIGSALGIAVLGTLLFTGTQSSLEQKLSTSELPDAARVSIVDAVVDSAGSAIPKVSEALVAQNLPQDFADSIQKDAGDAFTEGARFAAWSASGFLLLGFLSTFRISSPSRSAGRAKRGSQK
jgi:predicted MFS family arabinose efflux permease